MGGGTVVRGGGATMSIAGSWVEWLWAVAIAAVLPLVFLLPTMVVWKATVDWKIGGTDSLSRR
ncbi:Protein kinase superfamily protein [Prunus dulcis]|uniref:Protein kinase superfamily protein n=1 Tax=Prunus dulcis TaxID=3755 RepID=A0A4Y1RY68_PRUDU|nr:Protein kinase superfamily protein [Prunus dulcis]